MRRLHITFLLSLSLSTAAVSNPHTVKGRVVDADSGQPISWATIRVLDTTFATHCDSAGFFVQNLPSGIWVLEVSHIGYQLDRRSVKTDTLTAPLVFELATKAIELTNAIMIHGKHGSTSDHQPFIDKKFPATETVLDAIAGVGLVRRANFGLEPIIRGTQAGRIGIAIDGMKIFSACVDRMDPVSAYVEIENLAKVEIAKGGFDLSQGQTIGGTINLVTQKPIFERPLSGQAEIGYESVSHHRFGRSIFNLARDNLALRGSFSYRQADDFKPGGRERLNNSQYAKSNFKFDLSHRGVQHQLNLSLLGDRAWNIGYPALLMDASLARSHLISAEHTWTPSDLRLNSARTRIYLSSVDHWMDDERRDIAGREFMRNMNMWMYGRTRTWGLLETLIFAAPMHRLELVFDLYQLSAFADMEMEMERPDEDMAPMYLHNLSDIRRRHLALTANYNRTLADFLQWRINLRFDRANQGLHDPRSGSQLAEIWDSSTFERIYSTLSLSTTFEYDVQPHIQLKLNLADGARIPTQLENYGFYLFDPSDDFIYSGNPDLKPERSRQLELSLDYEKTDRRISIDLYYNRISDYISGIAQDSTFKNYANIPSVHIYGGEVSTVLRLSEHLQFTTVSNYTLGYNSTFDEPLPYIPPLESRLDLGYEQKRYGFAFSARAMMRQTRIAHRTTLEDTTPGFIVYDGRARFNFWRSVQLKAGVENIFDRFFYHHLSVNNFPSPGRNFTAALDVDF